jgi:hypothetical protein
MAKIKQRERVAIIQSLSAGVVPKVGLEHIQVGRKDEINAIISDLGIISNNGSTIRFIVGRYGSGKSFFLNLCRLVALQKKFVVTQADITLEKRLYSTDGQARALYTELVHNFATRSKPEGGALSAIIQQWISDIDYRLRQEGKSNEEIIAQMHKELLPLQELVSGFDFALVLRKYFEGFISGNDILMNSAIRWLSGEYTTKTEARQDLGVRTIISDDNVYNYLKLWAKFVRLAGYSGLLVNLDEMGVLSHRLNNAQSRNNNYEKILTIVNDCLQGNVQDIGFIFAGVDDFMYDRRRGLASYEALERRLIRDTFKVEGLKDFSGPVIHLDNLSIEDTVVLLRNIRNVFAYNDPEKYLIPDEGIAGYLNHCAKTLGADFYLTPGDVVKGYVRLLSVMEQNPGTSWESIIKNTTIEKTEPAEVTKEIEKPEKKDSNRESKEDLVSFKL